jgi:ABC-type uncharacterized transport system auxiliary subunit
MKIQTRMKPSAAALALAAVIAAALLLTGCTTVNRLSDFNFRGASLATRMRTPPQPRMDVSYHVTLDKRNVVFSALSVVTNMAKAAQAQHAENAMNDALASVDVPGIVLRESASACAYALDARLEDQGFGADYLLDLDIQEWGVRADSPGSAVELSMRLTASLVRSFDHELIWQRSFTVRDPASPSMFGLGQIADTMVSATVLSNMTAFELEGGFRQLAEKSARTVARLLEKDLSRARYGG